MYTKILANYYGYYAANKKDGDFLEEYANYLVRLLSSKMYFHDIDRYKFHLDMLSKFLKYVAKNNIYLDFFKYQLKYIEFARKKLKGFSKLADISDIDQKYLSMIRKKDAQIVRALEKKNIYPPKNRARASLLSHEAADAKETFNKPTLIVLLYSSLWPENDQTS